MKRALSLAAASAWVGLLVAASASAQSQGYQPPVFRADEKGLRLIDAVRLSLQHDPFILLQEADSMGRKGVARELSGQFDYTLRGSGAFDYLEQELPESVKRQQRKDRQDLIDVQPGVISLSESLDALTRNLADPRVLTDPDSVDLTAGITDDQTRIEALALQTNLSLITQLINAATSPTLRQNLIDLRQQTFELGQEQIQRAGREANRVRLEIEKALQDLGAAPVDEWRRSAKLHLDLAKQFRSGIGIAPFFDLTYSAQNFKGKESTDIAKGGQGVRDTYRSEVGFDVRVPLLRGLGKSSVAAAETAARKDYEASRFSLLHEKSRSVLETARAYWELRAASEELEVARRSEKLEAELLALTQALISAKERPRSDEARVLASHADALARVASGERRLSDTRVNLARVMGMALESAQSAPLPADPFPEPPPDLATNVEAVATLAREAVEQRMDRKALVLLEEAAGVLATGARKDTKPRLDLQGRLFGTSTGEAKLTDLDRWVFKSASGALALEVPFANDTLRGRLAQRESSLDIAEIDSADRARTITLNVFRLSQSLQAAADQLARAEDAVRSYDKTIEDEQAKLKAGDSTLVDTILTEQQTTAARLARVA
ncbi:MAG TPA: TolC family protein, partial [Vicinamibacteria bacterium]|nr:TolC family protein [Vicinamibacteria bacterium]